MGSDTLELQGPAVFLDRDGVLNACVCQGAHCRPPWTLQELALLPGVAEACAALKGDGWRLFVVTNQPDVARGRLPRQTADALNRRLARLLPLDGIFACFHDDSDACLCRKPKPGMILDAAASHRVDLRRSWLIGDRCKDIQAGCAAGLRTILITQGPAACRPDLTAPSFAQAAPMVGRAFSDG